MCYGTRTVVKDQPLQSENDDMLWRMCGLRSRVLREWLPLVTLNVAAARVLCLSATLLWMRTAIETRGAENSSQPPRQSVQEANGWTGVALAGPTGGLEEIVFAVRSVIPEHWYANFGYFSPDASQKCYGKGGRLCRLNLKTGKVTTLVDDPEGAVRDPCVHHDGQRIVFSYRQCQTDTYHLWEIRADGTGLRQLTDGIYDDIEPSYLADGGIVFVSARSRRWVQCWLTQVASLHHCESDGSQIRPLSANLEHDNTPWPLPDGRILYTRWEYVDRSQVHYHHLWTMNPDGTSQAVFFGNLHPGDVYIDAKPIPGTDRVVLIRSPGHGATGACGICVHSQRETRTGRPAFIAGHQPRRRFPRPLGPHGKHVSRCAQQHGRADERPRVGRARSSRCRREFGAVWLHEPRPLVRRSSESRIPPHVDLARSTGHYLLSNVYDGRNMAGVKPGEIKKLLVLESLPKPVNFTGGMDPLSYVGTFTLERVLGTVPVEADGSAYFEAPRCAVSCSSRWTTTIWP